MNITIFCSAADVADVYTAAARDLATSIAQKGHTLVWGGSNVGTMKVIADAAQAAGGKIVGVSVERLKASARAGADEMIVTKDWPERRATLLSRGDAIVVLPGGLGTLDEVSDVLEQKKQHFHNKPVVFLNTDGFYEGFKQQLERMEREGFLPHQLSEFAHFVDTPDAVMRYIESHVG